MKKLFENKPRAWFILGSIFVFLLTMFAVAYFGLGTSALVANDVVAKIDGKKILLADFKSWLYSHDNMGTSQDPGKWEEIKNDDEQKKYYIDSFVRELLMKKEATAQNITVSDAEIDKRYEVPTSNYENLTDEQKRLSRENVKSDILKEKLEDSSFGWVTGDYVFYRFDKYYQFEGEEVVVEGAGDQALIQKQRTYADKMAKEAYTRLSANETTIADEAKKLEDDPEISYKAFAPLTPHISGKSTREEYLLNISLFDTKIYENFKSSISNLEKDQISQPFVLRGSVNGKMQDIAFVIYHAKDKGNGQFMDGESWYLAMLEKYKVSIYYSNLGIKKVEDKITTVKDFINNITPKAYADCSLAFNSTHGTQFLAETLVLNADGATWTRWPYARYQLQAGTSSASPQLKVWGHDCAYWGKVFNETKSARDNGYMHSSQTYWVPNNPNFPEQLAFLADCSRTSTAAITGFKPTSPAWITNSGTMTAAYACCYNWSAGGGDGADSFAVGLNMAGYNGLTMHTAFYYQPHYNTAPTPVYVTPAAGANFTANATGTTSINFTVRGNDLNGDSVQLAVAYCKIDPTSKACTSSWSYVHKGMSQGGPWSGSQPLTAQGVDTVMPPTEQLGVGDYKWVTQAIDEHGAIDTTFGDEAVIDCSVRSECIKWTHDIPRYFKINPATPVAALECNITPASGIAPLSVFATVSGYVTGSTFDYDFDYPSTSIVTTLPNPFQAMYVGRGSSISFSYATVGTYNIAVRERFSAGGSREIMCGPVGVTVTSPNEGTGGEVAP